MGLGFPVNPKLQMKNKGLLKMSITLVSEHVRSLHMLLFQPLCSLHMLLFQPPCSLHMLIFQPLCSLQSWPKVLRMTQILISTKFAASVSSDIFVRCYYGILKYNYKHFISVKCFWQLHEVDAKSIFAVLTLLLQDLCNPPWHAVNELLGHILTDGSPILA